MVSKKRIVMLLLVGVVVATMVVLAVYAPAQAQSYGATSAGSTGTTGAKTGAELGLFAVAGTALLGAGYFLTRKSKA